MSTNIEWTDVTDNIIVAEQGGWWCRKISPGCAHCYAAKLNDNSFYGGNHLPYTGSPPKLKLRREILSGWARQRQSKKHFVASMTDIFGEWVPREWIFEYLDAMAAAPRQTFQLLTKRADVMQREVTAWLAARSLARVPDHIWLGVSVEDRGRQFRLNHLMKIPAVRFASFEPLLEELSFCGCWLSENTGPNFECEKCGKVRLMLDWAILGGESGPGARPCNVRWIRSLVQQCQSAGVATFVKQLGARIAGDASEFYVYQAHYGADKFTTPVIGANAGKCPPGYDSFTLTDKKGGTMNSWPKDLQIREFPTITQSHPEVRAGGSR